MMANCPKCNAHLRLIDWKQHCPHCGANIVIYNLQERLMDQADEAEVQHYHFQKKVDRVKGSFIGSPLAIARIFTSILPIGPLFLPIVTATLGDPFKEYSGKVSLLEIYKNTGELKKCLQLFGAGNQSDMLFGIATLGLLLSVVLAVLHFALNTLACSPKGKVRNFTVDTLMAVSTAAAVIPVFLMKNDGCVSASAGLGLYLYAAAQAINIIIDALTFAKGIEIKHAQCYCGGIPIEEYFEMVENGATKEEIRKEQYKRLQAIQDETEARLKAEEEAKAEAEKKEAVHNG